MKKNSYLGFGLVCFIGLAMIAIAFGILSLIYWDNTGVNRIIYDRQNQQIVAPENLTFWQWMKNRNALNAGTYQYYFMAEEVEFWVYEQRYAFKARVRLPKTNEAARQFYENSSHSILQLAVSQCANEIAGDLQEQNIREEENSQPIVRMISLPDMNKRCPLTGQGYQWTGSLELVQCPLPEINDPAQKMICLDLVRNRQ